ncbi:hypothetical protein PR002_g17885 [Phytophthora rubi]|uniref:Uncharacterized protein n=1 Tax=Phytophthora rubi TaxID=129364 RepID=A0A6A3K1S7_9STRA|nr:hypothetical protein PR002_g17885 [Phytophthora rubi]
MSALEHLQRAGSTDTREHASQSDPRVTGLLAELAQALHQQPAPVAAPESAALLNWTVPNSRGASPPAAICELRAAYFPSPATRARGDFVPAAIYILAAHRLYPYLLTPEGLHETPLSFVMRWRIVASMTFNDSLPILIALDLAASVCRSSPPTPPVCRDYQDLLSAVQGWMSFANAHWYQPMAQSLYRVPEFVMANMDADPAITHRRVQHTLHEVNQQLGAAFVHLSSDSPFWWREFSTAIGRIDYHSASWSMALHD